MKAFEFPGGPRAGGSGQSGPERRRWQRRPGPAGLRCSIGGGRVVQSRPALVADLAPGGARLLSPARLPADQWLPVLLYVPGYGVAVPATARVVYAQPAPDGHWFHGIHFAEALVADDLHGLTAENLGTVARHAAQP